MNRVNVRHPKPVLLWCEAQALPTQRRREVDLATGETLCIYQEPDDAKEHAGMWRVDSGAGIAWYGGKTAREDAEAAAERRVLCHAKTVLQQFQRARRGEHG
jgi:hypothetical protein